MTRAILEQMTIEELGEYCVGVSEMLADRVKAKPRELHEAKSGAGFWDMVSGIGGDSFALLRDRFERYMVAHEILSERIRRENEAERLKASGTSPN